MSVANAIPEPRARGRLRTIAEPASVRIPVPVQLAILIAVTLAVFSDPILWLVEMRESNGYAHVAYAQKIAETHILYPGHFLYHVLTVAAHGALSVSWLQAHFVVMLAARVLLAVVVWALVRQALQSRDSANDALLAIVLTLALLFVSAVTLPTWGDGNYYLGYITANLYVSQTLWVLQPLALLTFFAVLQVLSSLQSGTPPVREVIVMAVLALVSTLTKPSFSMILIPGVATLLLLQRQFVDIVPVPRVGVLVVFGRFLKDVKAILILGLGLVVPVFVAIGWIYASTYLAYQDLSISQDTGIRIAPFKVMAYIQSFYVSEDNVPLWLAAKFLLSILFPAAVALAYFSRVRRDPRFVLAWLQFAFGAFIMYFLAEEPQFGAANFTWSGHIAMFVLFVVSALILVEQTISGPRSRWGAVVSSKAAILCYFALLLHVIGGYGIFAHPSVN